MAPRSDSNSYVRQLCWPSLHVFVCVCVCFASSSCATHVMSVHVCVSRVCLNSFSFIHSFKLRLMSKSPIIYISI